MAVRLSEGRIIIIYLIAYCGVVVAATERVLTLRSVVHHGVNANDTVFLQHAIPKAQVQAADLAIRIKTRPRQLQRLADRRPSTVEPLLSIARKQYEDVWEVSSWVTDIVESPDITDRATVINFALMAANAYTLVPGTADWEDLDAQFGFNTSGNFGWNSNGLRGHVYSDDANTTVIIGIKGTTLGYFDNSVGETSPADKQNDNLYFSCCCAQQGPPLTFNPVCKCASSVYGCDSTCLVQNLRQDHRYYQAALYVYSNVTAMYPQANIWVTGHSLGGAISSLLGLTYGLPVFAFEAPGDALPASRLKLPTPRGLSYARPMTEVYNIGHTADSIYMGTCNGVTSSCALWGYAFESECHAGSMCTYDTVGDHGWWVNPYRHSIQKVISDVLRVYDTVPECVIDDECVDCARWNFHNGSGSSTTISTSSKPTYTSTSSSSCESPYFWFWCNDKTAAIASATVAPTGPAQVAPSLSYGSSTVSRTITPTVMASSVGDEMQDHEL